MGSADRLLQQRTALSLARLAREQDLRLVFVERKGLDVLLALLSDTSRGAVIQKEAAGVPPCVLGFRGFEDFRGC